MRTMAAARTRDNQLETVKQQLEQSPEKRTDGIETASKNVISTQSQHEERADAKQWMKE